MAIEDVKDEVAEIKDDVKRALSALVAVRAQVTELTAKVDQLQDVIDAGTPATSEDLDEVLAGLQSIEDEIEAVIPEETEEAPPAEEPPPDAA